MLRQSRAAADRPIAGPIPARLAGVAGSTSTQAAIVGAVTVVGFLLRLAIVDQSLAGDELSSYRYTVDRPLSAVLSDQGNPPLFYVLAWASVKLGDPTASIRLPSLVLGTAAIPLVYAIGRSTVGRAAALVGTIVVAISPFAIFHSTDARAYSTLIFFTALSTLSLLVALDTGRRRWWALYAIASAAAFYTHYMAVFVLLAQAAWGLWAHRRHVRALLLANAAVTAGCLPIFASTSDGPGVLFTLKGFYHPLTVSSVVEGSLQLFPGHPVAAWSELPGRVVAFVLAAAIAVAALVAAARLLGRRRERGAPSRGIVLVAALGLATPLGLILYALTGPDTFESRYLSASLPGVALLIGALTTSVPRRLSLPVTSVVIAMVAVGSIKALTPDYRRTPYKAVAEFIDHDARPGDAVVDPYIRSLDVANAFFFPEQARRRGYRKTRLTYLSINLERDRSLVRVGGVSDAAAATRSNGRVFVVGPQGRVSPPPPGAPLRPVGRRTFPGVVPLEVRVYERSSRSPEGERRVNALSRCLGRQGLEPVPTDGPAGAVAAFTFPLSGGGSGLALLYASAEAAERAVGGVRTLIPRSGGEAERRGSAVVAYLQEPTTSDKRGVARCL